MSRCWLVTVLLFSCLFYESFGKSVAGNRRKDHTRRQFLPSSTCSYDYECTASRRCDPIYNICVPEQDAHKRQFLPIPTCSYDYECPMSSRCDTIYNICIPEQGHSVGKR